ncbi:MAG: hypothetical protein JWO91_3021 [Acidobacteriaceae bacterium]|nr:hypothetical protein [Acidobacteriaceae bacterium]
MLKVGLLAFISVLTFSSVLLADQITLKNRGRLTGTIVKSDDKTLVIKTEFAGDVTVQWPAVQEIKSSEPLHVDLKNGQSAVGAVTTSDDKIAVATADKGVVTAPKEGVVDMRSASERRLTKDRNIPDSLKDGRAAGMWDSRLRLAIAKPKISRSPLLEIARR